MSISAYASFAYSRTASRMSQSIEAFMGSEGAVGSATKSQGKGSIGQDLVSLSPMTQMRNTLSVFKQTTSYTELNLSVSLRTQNPITTEEGVAEVLNGLDGALKMVAKDEEEYQSMREQLGSLLSQRQDINAAFNSGKSSSLSKFLGNNSSSQIAQSGPSASSKEEVKLNLYKLLLKMSKNGGADDLALEDEPESISQAFFKSLSSIFTSISFESKSTATLRPSGLQQVVTQSQSTSSSSSLRIEEAQVEMVDPLVLDLSGEGIKLTKAGEGAHFDITADGSQKSVAWVRENTAFLVYDKNGNGVIDDGGEFFGDQNGAADGFKELAKYDDNGDGIIDSKDKIYSALKLYRDLNGNGSIDDGELSTLEEMGIKQLNLDCVKVDQDINGNKLIMSGSFERMDGSSGQLADVLLGYKNI